MNIKIIPFVNFLFEFIIIMVLAYTGFYKIIHFEDWIEKTGQIDFIREYRIVWLSYLLPFIELLTAIFFCIKRTKKIAAYLSVFLMTGFTIYIFYKIYIAEDSLCPCGGIFSSLTLDKHLLVNIILLIMSIILLFLYSSPLKIKRNDLN